ncbi:MAG: hypothetical protein Q7U75_17430 [Desulfobacterales bacterium]|nr:hypothetical protein [Desulfobacterales bacterium]
MLLFLFATLIPVFFAKIHTAPFWLAAQAAALAGVIAQHKGYSFHTLAEIGVILVVRAALTPGLLHQAIRRRSTSELNLLPSNLFVWTIGVTLVLLAFEFAAPVSMSREAFTLGVVGATIVVALLLLSTNGSAAAQLVAVLFMENALALFESLLSTPWPLAVRSILDLTYLLTVFVGAWLIGTPETHPVAKSKAKEDDI